MSGLHNGSGWLIGKLQARGDACNLVRIYLIAVFPSQGFGNGDGLHEAHDRDRHSRQNDILCLREAKLDADRWESARDTAEVAWDCSEGTQQECILHELLPRPTYDERAESAHWLEALVVLPNVLKGEQHDDPYNSEEEGEPVKLLDVVEDGFKRLVQRRALLDGIPQHMLHLRQADDNGRPGGKPCDV
eukprot:scaffold4756_cov357-Prasinococcus_capsulatus_cf.AAC.6